VCSIGLHYVSADDSLIVVLVEGSVIVIADASQKGYNREWRDHSERILAPDLSRRVKQIAENAEGRTFDSAEYARIHAVQFMGVGSYVVWAQE
jgi:hypothetical protein